MGSVWAATHVVTQRQVALKLIRETVGANPETQRRFFREARAASAARHPNVIDVLDVFTLEGDTPVMVMELLNGETLKSRLARETRLSIRDAATLLLPAVSAVGDAHALGIIHRDLKPDNIFLCARPDSPAPLVKVLDFGLAKMTFDQGSKMTQTGAMMGTPFYMAPEQALGESDVDHRVDVWALGVILFECLSGKRPFSGDSVAQVMAKLLTAPVPTLDSVTPDAPEDVAALVARMLVRDPAERLPDLVDARLVLSRYGDASAPDFSRPLSKADDISPLDETMPGPFPLGPSSPSADRANAPASTGRRADSGGRGAQSLTRSRFQAGLPTLVVLGAAVLCTLAAGTYWAIRSASTRAPAQSDSAAGPASPPSRRPQRLRLTGQPPDRAVIDASLSPDGTTLAYVDPDGLALLGTREAAPRRLPQSESGRWMAVSWSADGSQLIATSRDATGQRSIWRVPAHGGPPVLARDHAWYGIESPTRSATAFLADDGIWVSDPSFDQARRVVPRGAGEGIGRPAFSADGTRLAFVHSLLARDGMELSVTTTSLTGESTTVVVTDYRLRLPIANSDSEVVWLRDGRIVYSRRNWAPEPEGSDLWAVAIDAGGSPAGQPLRLTDTPALYKTHASASADGLSLSYVETRLSVDVFTGELGPGPRLSGFQRLTQYEGADECAAFTPDGRSLVFHSDRGGRLAPYLQPLRSPGSDARCLTSGSAHDGGLLDDCWEAFPAPTPDGESVLYFRASRSQTARRIHEVRRVSLAGGESELVVDLAQRQGQAAVGGGALHAAVKCAYPPSRRCVLMVSSSSETTVNELDPARGRGAELARFAAIVPNHAALAPDGSALAVPGTERRIDIVSLQDASTRPIRLDDTCKRALPAWEPGDRLVACCHAEQDGRSGLVAISPEGHVTQLWRDTYSSGTCGSPAVSPDGRTLSATIERAEANAWMMTGM